MSSTIYITNTDFTCAAHVVAASPLTIEAPVGDGARCANRAADVRRIQAALNRFGTIDGGPAPKLSVDAVCGPLTKAAILRFQRKWGIASLASNIPHHQTWEARSDGIVDVGGPTIDRLRRGPGASASAQDQLKAHVARVLEVLTASRAALTLAKSSLNLPAGGIVSGSGALSKVEKHFHVSKTPDPPAWIANIEKRFLQMQSAIGHVPQGVVLLVNEPPTIAVGSFFFTFAGGWSRHDPAFEGLRTDSIYLCPKSRTLNSEAVAYGLIHELGHYVADDCHDKAYFHKAPQQYRSLTAEAALNNADSFAQFAFEAAGRPDFRVDQNTI